MSETILKIEDLQVRYGGIEAVKGISFDVQQGQIVTLIGSNGAGKSSTLRTISGLVKPSGGKITFQGEDITGKDPTQIVTQGVTLVPEGRRIFPDMTVLENLKIGAYLRKDDLSEDLEWVYSLFPRLKERSWQAGGTLSGGEQQMLAMGRALMSHPKLIVLDEPSMGLSPIFVNEIFDIINFVSGIHECINYGQIKSLDQSMKNFKGEIEQKVLDSMRTTAEGIQPVSYTHLTLPTT